MRVVQCLVYQVSWRVFFFILFGSVSVSNFLWLRMCVYVCVELIDRLCDQ